MSDARKVRTAVERALDAPAEARERVLIEACAGDASLLDEARSMLAAYASADRHGFLRSDPTSDTPPAPTPAMQRPPIAERPGDRIGRYKLLQEIGEGGFGVVFMAEQESPIKRRVALKVIKAGMDTRAVVARFEAERQALAMMDHPNIAKVFDGGTTDTGRPFFVMELVRGVPVTQFCDDAKLTTRQRVELLIPICQAVQHAHQKGVIHRDLKPSNVLVTLHDGRPVPKVIDFGIAKATGPSLTEKTLFTDFRGMLGTPAYMSPEQAEMSGLDVDTRSDVYSLGVLMYELLTGTTPFDTTRLVKAGLMEVQRIIREEEPPRPSDRLSTLGERLTTVASQRGIEPARIGKLVAGELDWIVMRAMEKDRRRRYETVNDLAADLGRHLAGEPVVAAPPSAAYRARKFVRKHRRGLIVTAAIGALLVGGVVGTSTQLVRAIAAEREATRQRDRLDAHTQKAVDVLRGAVFSGRSIPAGGSAVETIGGDDAWTFALIRDKDNCDHFRVYRGKVDPIDLTTGTFKSSLTPVEPTSALAALATKVDAANEALRAERDAAETEAYVANLALAQAAMREDRWPEARQRLDACPEAKRGWEWRFLRGRANSVERSMPIFGDNAVFSPDGKLLCTEELEALYLWNAQTGEMVPWDPPRSVNERRHAYAFSPDSRSICVATQGTAVLLDLKGRPLFEPMKFDGRITRVRFGDDGRTIIVDSETGERFVWALDSGLVSPVPRRPNGSADDVAESSRSEVFCDDGRLRLVVDGFGVALEASDGRSLGNTWPIVRAGYTDPIFAPDMRHVLLASGRDIDIGVWPTHRELIELANFDSPSRAIEQNADLELDLLESIPRTRTFDFETDGFEMSPNGPLTRIKIHGKVIGAVGAAGDGSWVVYRHGKPFASLPWVAGADSQIKFFADGTRAVTSGYDGQIRFYDVETWRELVAIPAKGKVKTFVETPDGTRLVIRFEDGSLEVWDTRGPAARQADRDARFAEIPAAREYVAKLLATDAWADKCKQAIRDDTSIPTLRKLVALEQLDLELSRRRAATQPATRP